MTWAEAIAVVAVVLGGIIGMVVVLVTDRGSPEKKREER